MTKNLENCSSPAEPMPRPEPEVSVSAPDPIIATATIKCGPEEGLFELITFYGHRFEIDLRKYPTLRTREQVGPFLRKMLSTVLFDTVVMTGIPIRQLKEPKP
jgi:hypothetical protein